MKFDAHTPESLRQVANWYRERAREALRKNTHDRKFYLRQVKRHEEAAAALEGKS